MPNSTGTISSVWNELLAGYTTADSAGKHLSDIADLTAEIKVYLGSIRTALLSRRFYSDPQASATLDTTGTTDVALPSVTIPAAGIPTDAVIEAVFATVLIGHRKDTSGSDNAINGDQYIQVKESVAGSYTNAIKISDNTFPIDVSEATVIGGPVVFGNIDVVSQVSAVNKTYNFQWANTRVDGNNMILYDIQTMLEVLYTVP